LIDFPPLSFNFHVNTSQDVSSDEIWHFLLVKEAAQVNQFKVLLLSILLR